MDFSAFSHGQVHSKIWLCAQLERIIENTDVELPLKVAVLGSWYNILGFLMLVRNEEYYKQIVGVDNDLTCMEIANKICNAYYVNNGQLENWYMSVDDVPYKEFDLIINTSIENIKDDIWYDKIPDGKLVCLQTCNLKSKDVQDFDNWNIVNAVDTLDELKIKFPMTNILYTGEKVFDYGTLKYTRYMVIGKK
jgi:hypothetical protein